MKRLTKEHFKVMMKVWLNAGRETYLQLINDSEKKFITDLIEDGYIEIVNRSYLTIPYETGFSKIMDNFVENLEIMNVLLNNDEKRLQVENMRRIREWEEKLDNDIKRLEAENIRRIRELQEKYNCKPENSK